MRLRNAPLQTRAGHGWKHSRPSCQVSAHRASIPLWLSAGRSGTQAATPPCHAHSWALRRARPTRCWYSLRVMFQ